MGVQLRGGGWIYPDLIVTEEPGHFIRMLGIVVLRHEVTEVRGDAALAAALQGGPLLPVPAGRTGHRGQPHLPVAGHQGGRDSHLAPDAGLRSGDRVGLQRPRSASGRLLAAARDPAPRAPTAPSGRPSTAPTTVPPRPSAGARCCPRPRPKRRPRSRPAPRPTRPLRHRTGPPTRRPTTPACRRASTCRPPASSPWSSPLA